MNARSKELARTIAHSVESRRPAAERLFSELQSRTKDPVAGVTRASYGEGEQIAHDLLARIARALALETGTDPAGNLYMTLPGRDRNAPSYLAGSHLDSVPQGGNYDGAAGVIAAITAVAAIKEIGIVPPRDLTVMAIRAEECSSWFVGHHGGHLGSRAALGLLWAGEMDSAIHVATGKTLAEHIDGAGFDAKAVRDGPPHLSRDRIKGYFEVHIEQGPVLAHKGYPVGIVTAIRGCVRARNAKCIGEYTHSGAVPQELRRDAVLATAEFVHELDRIGARIRKDGEDLVFAAGKFYTDSAQHTAVKVPGEANFTLDFRSQDISVLKRMRDTAGRLATKIGARRNVSFELGELSLVTPATMNPGFRRRMATGARLLGVKAMKIPSGGGHDAADFHDAGIPSAMIFVRNENGSHNPDEHMEMADFVDATKLLAWMLATAD